MLKRRAVLVCFGKQSITLLDFAFPTLPRNLTRPCSRCSIEILLWLEERLSPELSTRLMIKLFRLAMAAFLSSSDFSLSASACQYDKLALSWLTHVFWTSGRSMPSASYNGSTMTLMNPSWDEGMDVLSALHCGEIGRPSSRSLAPWSKNSCRQRSALFGLYVWVSMRVCMCSCMYV